MRIELKLNGEEIATIKRYLAAFCVVQSKVEELVGKLQAGRTSNDYEVIAEHDEKAQESLYSLKVYVSTGMFNDFMNIGTSLAPVIMSIAGLIKGVYAMYQEKCEAFASKYFD